MDEEHKDEQPVQPPAPPRFRYKGFKFLTLTLFFLVIFFVLGFTGLKATSSSQICSSCHEMKPEYYTWKTSSHSEVDCVECHTDPVFKTLAKDQAEGAVGKIKNQPVITFTAPIHMTTDIPNSACEKCHDMSTRQVTPAGDIIIPHDKHLKAGIECVQCHSGVAHGKIADRKMTFEADYDKWDQAVGTSAMADVKFTQPDMDTCTECHKARNVSTACKTCHTTGMIPSSHKQPDFKTKTHGQLAAKDIQECNKCHKYMSTVPLDGYDNIPTLTKFLNQDPGTPQKKKNQFDYAQENTFCKACHGKKPPSHTKSWINDHGSIASKDRQECLACHTLQPSGGRQTTTPACSSCHPSIHEDFNKKGHPVPLADNQQITSFCYTCHVKSKCSACHKE